MVVVREWAIRSEEDGHVRVVSLRDLFAVESFLDDALKIALALRFLSRGRLHYLGGLDGRLRLVVSKGLGVERVAHCSIELGQHVRVGLTIAKEDHLRLASMVKRTYLHGSSLFVLSLTGDFNFRQANVLVLK
jgi:hypothetical protein